MYWDALWRTLDLFCGAASMNAVAENGKPPKGEPTFWVRDLPVYGDLVLSPMAGYSDLPYRLICREFGSAMSYTEFVSALALVNGPNDRSLRMLRYRETERPVVFQIFDNDEDRLNSAAQSLEKLGPDVIDLNMGCSVRHVSGRGAGAGLLRDPSKIGRIFRRLVQAVSVPVTGKIRLGWDEDSLNYIEVSKTLEDSGASLIAIHGRTQSQSYGRAANWDAIAEVVDQVQVPVIGNGDVRTVEDIDRMKAHTGCVAVMIGRGAIGHPWIFRRRNREDIRFGEKATVVRRHFKLMIQENGERLALLLMRKHIARYLKGCPGIRDLQQQLVRVSSVSDFHRLLDNVVARVDSDSTVPSNAFRA
jgi:nifR3 family TIM-barrel protein